jgi:hypothetical protein
MSNVSIPAHFDGERILLDEPIDLEPNTKLIVTVLAQNDAEHEQWLRLSNQGLENAYGTDADEYSLESIREANPEYDEGRRRNSHSGSSS